ncbi:MAG TPA: hypothetical protein VK207_08995 [Bacteroidales bacterium]|nr:hypothetical protein [Bacteroidales bacterium]
MRRAATAMQIISTNFVELPFDGIWKDLIGTPELSGCWIIWGESANGKTAFSLQLAKYLAKFVRVAYNSLEEGISKSLRDAIEREKMTECQGRFLVLDKEPIAELEERIKKHKSPSVFFIDSVQYSELNKITAKKLIDRYPHKLFIFTSHASGKMPEGRTAQAIRYHADVKIRVEGFRAFAQGRFGNVPGRYYTIYPEGASHYWKFQETII